MIKFRVNEFFKRDKGSIFRQEKPDFQYDSKTGEVIEVGMIDIQEYLNSSKECALDYILEKFNYNELVNGLADNPEYVKIEDKIFDLTKHPDLSDLADFKNTISVWRDKLNLNSGVSDKEILDAMYNKSVDLNKLVKGMEENEKTQKNDAKSEQA